MRLETLSLRQWRVFETLDLDFPDGLIGVRGPNGAGKTTLAEAIGWALFGKLRGRAKVADLRRQGAPEGTRSSVTLTLRIGDVRYRIERVVNGSARLWIGEGAEPETSQTTATNLRIAQELNMTWDLFCRTVYARQKDVAALDPAATGEARRQHVERLLGLGRVRDAAGKARDEHKRLKAELGGMRLAAPDVLELRRRLEDAERRALDTPAIATADNAAQVARAAFNAARAATGAEAVRAARYGDLAPRLPGLERDVVDAQQRLQEAQQRCSQREAAAATIARIADQASGWEEAETRHRLWQALADASQAHSTAAASLAELDFDPALDTEQSATVQQLRSELDTLVVPDGVAALSVRVQALDVASRTEALGDAQEHERQAARLAGVAARTAAGLEAQLAAEREHLQVLHDDDASCPVCLRPFEGSREGLVAEHQQRIDRLAAELASAERSRAEAEETLTAARESREAAARAADALAATAGAATLAEARAELALATAEREQALERRDTLRAAISELEAIVRDRGDARMRHGALTATLAARREDVARHCGELGVTAHDPHAHAEAAESAARLGALRDELVHARATASAAEGCDVERDSAHAHLEARRNELKSVRDALATLDFDPETGDRLTAAEHTAETHWDELRTAAEQLRVAAAQASTEVTALRDQITAAEQLQREIAAAEIELRAHAVAHDLLVSYRDAQTKRAWPALEQTAGALLAQATDGRYADVRFSGEDFRLVIVDRGEEHPFDRYSGGEQDLANLCVRLAIADWIARERDVELGFVILDEVFGSQDDDRRRGLIDQLRRLSERFHQMLVISHVPEIADQCDSVIVLEQTEQGRSRIAA